MSEQGEHASNKNEDQTNAADRSTEEHSKSDIKMIDSQIETNMLEDEEMPTYISVSSPSRREDGELGNTKETDNIPVEEEHSRSPYPSDDQAGGSVYVLSSGEDSEHPPYNDEDEDDYGESEEMLDEEEEEEDEDEDEENPLRMHNDDDEDIEGEYDAECFERSSDDFLLNNRLKPRHRKRGLSLQDLSVLKNNDEVSYIPKRNSLNVPGPHYSDVSQNYIMYANARRRTPLKYKHVGSKVKQYINDIKEQCRRSQERRMKEKEHSANINATDVKDIPTEQLNPTGQSKIKDYVERGLKELEMEEACTDSRTMNNMPRILENGQDKMLTTENENKANRMDTDINSEEAHNEKNVVNFNDKVKKRNGSVEVSIQNHISYQSEQNLGLGVANEYVINGHQQTPTVFNLRTLTYEEYMHGSINSSQKQDLGKNANVTEQEDAEMISVPDIDNSTTTCALKIENVKSIGNMSEESKDNAECMDYVKFSLSAEADRQSSENVEISVLKAQLSQKNLQYNNLKDAYEKAMQEMLRMKQEVDTLKQNLAKHERENKPPEMKSAAIQTEDLTEPILNQESAGQKQTDNKISASSITSTISSISPWMDSARSPSVSLKAPNIAGLLSSDDSMILPKSTPQQKSRPLSQAFATSSRILQTLSNIANGKTKSESSSVSYPKSKPQEKSTGEELKENGNVGTSDYTLTSSSSKKRKASDTLGVPNFIHPFKIPHICGDALKKLNPASNAETDLKCPQETVNIKSEIHSPSATDACRAHNFECPEDKSEKVEDTNDQEDYVKCFVYKEDENEENRSFLIQAEDPSKEEISIEKGRIKECGPYLIGNVEVRMSEVNGTISIWGKEINRDSIMEYDEDINLSGKSTETRSGCWPRTKFNGSNIVCSTNKKPRIFSKFSGSGINVSQCSHLSSCNGSKSRFSVEEDERQQTDGLLNPVVLTSPCDRCNCSKHCKERFTPKRIYSSENKIHSCTCHVELNEDDCGCTCSHERRRCVGSSYCAKEKLSVKDCRRFSYRNTSGCNKCSHGRVNPMTEDDDDIPCRHDVPCTCRHTCSLNVENSHSRRKCHLCKDTLQTCGRIHSNKNSDENEVCNRSPSNVDDDVPLISKRDSNETPEIRQQRLRGKRVRGILMDLLKGCGTCRNSAENKDCIHEMEASHSSRSPHTKVFPCSIPEPSYSSETPNSEECCPMHARIESQLREFRTDMERVRSRSDAILNMLKMLQSVDTN